MEKNKIQKNKQDELFHFLSFFYQQKTIKELKKKNILDIGIGNNFLANHLKLSGFQVTTCDINQDLKPDYVADIRNLPFKDGAYDVVTAFEVLEHLPFSDFRIALKEMKRVSRGYVVISLPFSSIFFGLTIVFPLIRTIFQRRFFNFFIKIPQFFRSNKYDGQHYWEIGHKGTSRCRIKKILEEDFEIKKEFQPFLNFYHYFFVLRIKK